MSAPIPSRLRAEFMAHMAAFDHDDMPDGAWFAMLEEGAGAFMRQHKLRGDRNDGAHQYLRQLSESQA